MTSETMPPSPRPAIKPLAPDTLEKILGCLALVLLAAALMALFRGRSQWGALPWQLWAHLATVLTALILTPVMMWRRRGDRLHRWLGWTWCVAMFATAMFSFAIRMINNGAFSLIHLLSVLTVVLVPLLILAARRHRIDVHRRRVRGLVIGALLVAGFFTFPFHRLMGEWLFG